MEDNGKGPLKGEGEAMPSVVYTDGACHGNPGPGGWAAVIVRQTPDGEEVVDKLGGGDVATTNNRMELMAAIRGLERLGPGWAGPVIVRTDARLVVDGMTQWLANWKARDWRTNDKRPVKNRELWERLSAAAEALMVEWQWVRGHAGNAWNEEADRLARLEAVKATPKVPA